ncbi:glycosyltransferase [Staphylococcus agnetis]|nr:glycosyltransferase [Staphylococcus agnetis]
MGDDILKNICTFIIPIYIYENRQLNYLRNTIEGIINQSDENWIAIFINDCSPIQEVDDFINNYRKCDKRINLLSLKKRISTGECRNIGIRWAANQGSEFILYNDADDISHPKRVEITKKLFKEHTNIGVVYSGISVIDENNEIIEYKNISNPIKEIINSLEKYPPQGNNSFLHMGIVSGYTNVTSATSVRTEIALRELFPDEYISEDMHTWYRYGAITEFYYYKNLKTKYRVPSYTVRQNSEIYTTDFSRDKVRVDIDGFYKALEKYKHTESICSDELHLLKSKFLLKLSESLGLEKRYDLAFKVAMQAKKEINNID